MYSTTRASLRYFAHLWPIAALLLLIASCSSPESAESIDPNFGAYLRGFTSGPVSAHTAVVVELAQPYEGATGPQGELPEGLLSLSPAAKGRCYLKSPSELVFQPDAPLKSATAYTAELRLDKLMPVAKGYELFRFHFETIRQDFSLYIDGFESEVAEDLRRLRIKALLKSAEPVNAADLAKAFTAKQAGRELPLDITLKDSRHFNMLINEVKREEQAGEVIISWDGKALGADERGEERVAIPALGDFYLISAAAQDGEQQSVVMQFSDPIARQELAGIIHIEGAEGMHFTISGHRVEAFLDNRLSGDKLLTINEGLRNIADSPINKAQSRSLRFQSEKPAVRMASGKAIMPVSQGAIVPFEAVGLRAVDVYVTKIFASNVLQYLQQYNLGQGNYLRQMGRDIHRHHIDLRAASGGQMMQWQQYHIDLAKIVSPDPGALYKVEVRFRQEYALAPCGDVPDAASLPPLSPAFHGSAEPGEYYYVDNYWEGFQWDWRNRENPCHAGYYYPDNTRASQVFVASDLGLTAKMGGDKKLFIAATDLGSAKPAAGADVQVYDEQQQVIATGRTDANGFATLDISRQPFVVMASRGKHRTWLKVLPYNALSVSKFQVQGAAVQDGLKGYLYGERGVWRPGDSLYLQFVLDDQEGILHKSHPVQFELRDPQGKLVQQRTRIQGRNGFYDFRCATDTKAPTGNYQAEVKIGNRSFERTVKIETVKPNRLKIAFDFGKELLRQGEALEGRLFARWLHGAKAGGLRAEVDMKVSPTRTTFEKWPGYQFDNELEYRVNSDETRIFEGKLDTEGYATLKPDISGHMDKAPGMMKLSFFTKVYEAGGNFSIDYQQLKYAPYPSFTGIRAPEGKLWGGALETDQAHEVDLVVVDPDGKKVERAELELTLYRLNRRWWYDRYDGSEFNFLNSNSYQKVQEEKVALASGRGKYKVQIDKENWGRYLLVVRDPVSGHASASFMYFDWPYWMRSNRSDSEASTVLGFSSDKEKYSPGERIKLTFPSPDNGRALVCIENGTRILERFWVETKAGETQVEVEVTPEMAPNVFANIALIQPHAQTENDRPMRMYGVVPILVEDPNTRLEPQIKIPEVMRPESKASIEVSEKRGRPMTYTLAVVDEGLLDLTRFRTPNPWDHFYAPEALGVRTWDMYDLVLGAFGQRIGSLLAIGGDDEGGRPANQKAMRFKPMVRYLGPFTLGPGEQSKHSIDVPNYLGSVRVMVVAGHERAYGNAEVAVPVRSPLMVIGTMPRVLGPDEQLSLPANVFALEEHVKDVEVTVRTNDLFTAKDAQTKTLRFDEPGDALALFDLRTTKDIGIGKVTIEARSGKERSVYEVEIEVRSPNPRYTIVRDTVLDPGSTWDATYTPFGLAGTNTAVLEMSSMPPINLEQRLEYLISYPHGCLEQTVSAAFPQLFLKQLTPLSATRQARVDEHISAALRKLRQFQSSEAGFSYWPGQHYYNGWSTAYATHFMLESEARGYALPSGLKRHALNSLRDQSRNWQVTSERNSDWSQRTQAYRLYVLALGRAAEVGAMNLLRERNDLDLSARWMLALAYTEAGQPEAARKLVDQLDLFIPQYTEVDASFGSALRDEAFVMLALQQMDRRSEAALKARRIAEALGSGSWYSTQSTAMALLAIASHGGSEAGTTSIQARLSQAGSDTDISTGLSVDQKTLIATSKASFKLRNDGEKPVFARLFLSGQPITGMEKAEAKGMKMQVNYSNAAGHSIDPTTLKAGTQFYAEVALSSPGSYGTINEMALTQVFPSGWEIQNMRLHDAEDGDETSYTYRDIRDDRVLTYFNLPRGKTLRFRVALIATYAGRYYLPAVLSYAMYDESIMATSPGRWVEVTSGGPQP